MNFGYKFLFSNLTITAPLVKSVLTNGVKTAATIRTTHVTTVIRAGSKENVVPPAAQALINFRTVPNHSSEEIIEQIKSLVNDDRIQISIFQDAIESSPISPSEGIGINEIKKAIHATFPETVAVPGLVITGTDCKNYTKLTPRIYRFVPYTFSNHNLSGIHGRNEYVTIQQFTAAVGYYQYLFGLL
jgi:carboxypeptidase PM20D1